MSRRQAKVVRVVVVEQVKVALVKVGQTERESLVAPEDERERDRVGGGGVEWEQG